MTTPIPVHKTCTALQSSTVRCPHKVVVTISLPVPGGTIRGASCQSHVEVVRRMVQEEAERRLTAVKA